MSLANAQVMIVKVYPTKILFFFVISMDLYTYENIL